jgi:hypothetical protein
MMNSTIHFVRSWKIPATTGVILLALFGRPELAQTATAPPRPTGDSLKSGFMNPPQSARPLVWWHWMNGNISKEGIKLDLEWMHRVGIGGFQNFDAALATPQVVDKRLAYMTPEWKDAFKYATTLADQLGLEEAIAGSPGWSESGGPWVPGPEAMKKYVWSETVVQGGTPFTGTLVQPPTNTGPFQNLPITNNTFTEPQFYADSSVVAYREPASGDMPQPKITWSGGKIDTALLTDGDLTTATALPKAATPGEKAWIQYEFPQPQRICALTIVRRPSGPNDDYFARGGNLDPTEALEASDDGVNFRVAAVVPKGGSTQHTIAFAPATAKYFRMTFKTMPPRTPGAPTPKLAADIALAELVLHTDARVNRFEEKAAFNQMPDLYGFATPDVASSDVIKKNDVIDLTGKFHPDGTLDWTPPPGKWIVLRIGYSLLGITNHPATKEATGLEVDKLNAGYVKNYMDRYLDSYKETVGAEFMGKRGIRYVINDSWEAGAQNWTDNMIADFTRLRGYDPRPWLPVLAGHVVESAKVSDQFLWDLRKTIADLTADEHYGQLEASLKERGIGHYGESHESGRAFIADGMEVKKLDDIPMSAMWVQSPGVNNEMYRYDADDRESASVAHIYGQNLAAAESMTAREGAWAWSPATLKPTADQELANGINRFVIHESAHQPLLDKAPGLTLGPYGQWFNRNETWAEEAGPWVKYLARSSYMLQQGRFAADVVYFYGEDSNLTAIFMNKAPDVPEGYGFDYINADGLIHQLEAANSQIATPSGMRYRVLALDPYSVHMSLPVLRAIHKLVEQGAVVAGAKPTDTPSLADDQAEFNKLNSELFGDGTGVHTFGKGKVYAGQSVESTLKALDVTPDFAHSKPEADTRIVFVHRKMTDGDIYFLDNRNDRDETVDASFRVTGKTPEIWHAETGKSEAVSYKIADGHTTVPLHLEPWGTVFVVFRSPARMTTLTLPRVVETRLSTVDGPWKVSFQEQRGAPASITLDKLSSWTENTDPGVKYFSGAGTYTRTIQASAEWFKPGAAIWIDLGDVKNLAEVSVNGTSLGVVWHAPYRVDITKALRPGANQVTVKVINAWVNRMIGDQQPNATKYTFADIAPYTADSALLPSGLLGPVVVVRATPQ